MTTATFDSNHAQTWKVLSACLAVVVAILIAAMGVESYLLYRASHLSDGLPAPRPWFRRCLIRERPRSNRRRRPTTIGGCPAIRWWR